VLVTADARAEADWWARHIARLSGQPIRPRPFDASVDGDIASDASDTGVGAFLSATSTPSSLFRTLLARAPDGMTRTMVASLLRRGIEFMAPLPQHLLAASSTLRELWGIATFIDAMGTLLRGGRFRVFMDNLGCVFILGGVVPAFAVGGKLWGEYVSGGSPDRALQRLALHLFEAQLAGGFTLQAVWVPRTENVRADFLSHASEARQHDYRLLPALFHWLDDRWGPHTIDRFACPATCQALQPPHTGRFCGAYFHPDAVWTDAFAAPWAGDNNWLFPPVPLIGRTVAYLRASRASGTLIVPMGPWAPWRPSLRRRGAWAPDVVASVLLGPAPECLALPPRYRSLFRDAPVYALRLDGRRCTGA